LHYEGSFYGGGEEIQNGGNTGLALFRGEGGSSESKNTVAFRVSGEGFLAFIARLEEGEVRDGRGNRVTGADVVDHDKSFSVYFCDPYGNPYELTTYDYNYVSESLNR
jgi:hypothetical protein